MFTTCSWSIRERQKKNCGKSGKEKFSTVQMVRYRRKRISFDLNATHWLKCWTIKPFRNVFRSGMMKGIFESKCTFVADSKSHREDHFWCNRMFFFLLFSAFKKLLIAKAKILRPAIYNRLHISINSQRTLSKYANQNTQTKCLDSSMWLAHHFNVMLFLLLFYDAISACNQLNSQLVCNRLWPFSLFWCHDFVWRRIPSLNVTKTLILYHNHEHISYHEMLSTIWNGWLVKRVTFFECFGVGFAWTNSKDSRWAIFSESICIIRRYEYCQNALSILPKITK